MNKPIQAQVTIDQVDELATRTKRDNNGTLITTLLIHAKIQPSEIARILNIVKQGAPLTITIGSDQLMMDLQMQVSLNLPAQNEQEAHK